MGYVDVAGVTHSLPDGRVLFDDVSFRVGEGAKVALVGPNGAGKTTLLRMIAGDLPVRTGALARAGSLGVMRQFIGTIGDDTALGDFALSLAEPRLRAAGERLSEAERAMRAAEAWKRLAPHVGLEHVPGKHNTCITSHVGDLAQVLNRHLAAA